jgi:hypothetical protein
MMVLKKLNFLINFKVIADNDVLCCNSVEKPSKKDLKGQTRVYTDKLIRLAPTEYYINKKDQTTQTKIYPSYMQQIERKKNWPALK